MANFAGTLNFITLSKHYTVTGIFLESNQERIIDFLKRGALLTDGVHIPSKERGGHEGMPPRAF